MPSPSYAMTPFADVTTSRQHHMAPSSPFSVTSRHHHCLMPSPPDAITALCHPLPTPSPSYALPSRCHHHLMPSPPTVNITWRNGIFCRHRPARARDSLLHQPGVLECCISHSTYKSRAWENVSPNSRSKSRLAAARKGWRD